MSLDTARAVLLSFFGFVGFTVCSVTAAVWIIGRVKHVRPVIRTRHFDLIPRDERDMNEYEGFELDWQQGGNA